MTEESGRLTASTDPSAPRLLLPVLCVFAFTTSLNAGLLNPLLPEIARDLGVSVALAGQLITVATLVGAFTAFCAGILSDIYGRRPFLIGGTIILAGASLGLALAPDFAWALAARGLAGFGFVYSVAWATVGDWYRGRERDRAVARVIAFDALAWVAGVPLIAVVAQVAGWRAGAAGLAGTYLLLTGLVAWSVPRRASVSRGDGLVVALRTAATQHRGRPDLLLVLLASGLRAVYWIGFLTYAGAMFFERHGLATWQLGPVLAAGAVAYVVGAELGSRGPFATRPRSTIAAASIGAGVAVVVIPSLDSLPLSVGAMLAYAALSGTAFSVLAALILRLAPPNRGMTLAVNGAIGHLGAALGVAVGGTGLALAGYPGLGMALASFAVVAAAVVLLSGRGAARTAPG